MWAEGMSVQSTSLIAINIHGGVSVTVPDSLDIMTHYVLREQEQWFEVEVPFIRRLLQPGTTIRGRPRMGVP